MGTSREAIMKALSSPVDIVVQGYAPLCKLIEQEIAAAGFVIVPKEPTEEMGRAVYGCSMVPPGMDEKHAKSLYRMMVGAYGPSQSFDR